ncbi:hypothetical protein [Ignatzschineria sp. LJL83]
MTRMQTFSPATSQLFLEGKKTKNKDLPRGRRIAKSMQAFSPATNQLCLGQKKTK